jgi:protein-tyrosine phosphatase
VRPQLRRRAAARVWPGPSVTLFQSQALCAVWCQFFAVFFCALARITHHSTHIVMAIAQASSLTARQHLLHLIHAISSVEEQQLVSTRDCNAQDAEAASFRTSEQQIIKRLVAEFLDKLPQHSSDAKTKELLDQIGARIDRILILPRLQGSSRQSPIDNNVDKFSCIVDDFLYIGGGGGGDDDYGFMVPAKQGWKHSPHHARVEKFMKKHNIKFILNVSHELMPGNRHHHRREYAAEASHTIGCLKQDDLELLRLASAEAQSVKALQSVITVFVPVADKDEFSPEFESLVATAALALELAWQRYVAAIARFPSEAPPRCFLHCVGGLNRSPFTAVYWLVHYHGVAVDTAWDTVRARRGRDLGAIDRQPLNSRLGDQKAAWRCGLQAGRPQVAWPQLQLDVSAMNNAQACITALQNGGLQSLSHVIIDDHPPWSPLQQQQPATSNVQSRLPSPLPFVPQHPQPQRSVSSSQSSSITAVTDLPVPSTSPTSAPSRLMPPPAVPTPVLPGSATPPTSLAGVPQSSRIFFSAHNIPSHLSADALKKLMDVHPGCLIHTLKVRQSREFSGANDVLVEFLSKSLADQCVSKLSGKPFCDSHGHMGNATFEVFAERELSNAKNKRPHPSNLPNEYHGIASESFQAAQTATQLHRERVKRARTPAAAGAPRAAAPEPCATPATAPSILLVPDILISERCERDAVTATAVQIFICASGIPADISFDELKQRVGLHPGCLVHTLKIREKKRSHLPSSPLPVQEFQVQFRDNESAIACQRALHGRPFADHRPEYGLVSVKKFVMTKEELDKRRMGLAEGQVAQSPRDPVQPLEPSFPAFAPVLREESAATLPQQQLQLLTIERELQELRQKQIDIELRRHELKIRQLRQQQQQQEEEEEQQQQHQRLDVQCSIAVPAATAKMQTLGLLEQKESHILERIGAALTTTGPKRHGAVGAPRAAYKGMGTAPSASPPFSDAARTLCLVRSTVFEAEPVDHGLPLPQRITITAAAAPVDAIASVEHRSDAVEHHSECMPCAEEQNFLTTLSAAAAVRELGQQEEKANEVPAAVSPEGSQQQHQPIQLDDIEHASSCIASNATDDSSHEAVEEEQLQNEDCQDALPIQIRLAGCASPRAKAKLGRKKGTKLEGAALESFRLKMAAAAAAKRLGQQSHAAQASGLEDAKSADIREADVCSLQQQHDPDQAEDDACSLSSKSTSVVHVCSSSESSSSDSDCQIVEHLAMPSDMIGPTQPLHPSTQAVWRVPIPVGRVSSNRARGGYAAGDAGGGAQRSRGSRECDGARAGKDEAVLSDFASLGLRIRANAGAVVTPICDSAKMNYGEQLNRERQGQRMMWDDSRYNKSLAGDIFVFSFHRQEVIVRIIDRVLPPSHRLPTWAANPEGQHDRNVLELSDAKFRLGWEEWMAVGGPSLVRATQPIRANLSSIVQRAREEFTRLNSILHMNEMT